MKAFAYKVLFIESGLLLLLGILPLSHAFYFYLHGTVSITAIIMLVRIVAVSKLGWVALPSAILAIFPAYTNVTMPRENWMFTDAVFGIASIAAGFKLGIPLKYQDSESEGSDEFDYDRAHEDKDESVADGSIKSLEKDHKYKLVVVIVISMALYVLWTIMSSTSTGTSYCEMVYDTHGPSCE